MLGVGNSISLIADGSLICSPCFQKYLNSGNITNLSATNATLQAQQIADVQVQFGMNPYQTLVTNSTVSIGQTYEPDVLGVSNTCVCVCFICVNLFSVACILDFLLCCIL